MSIEDEIAQKIKQTLENKANNNINCGDTIYCEYCGSRYNIKENKNCPNCGANNSKGK